MIPFQRRIFSAGIQTSRRALLHSLSSQAISVTGGCSTPRIPAEPSPSLKRRQALQFFHSTPCRWESEHDKNQKLEDKDAVADLFAQYAKKRDGVWTLDAQDICELLRGIGRKGEDYSSGIEASQMLSGGYAIGMRSPNSLLIEKMFAVADLDGNGLIDMEEFLEHAYTFIGNNPARIILMIGGPGSGKGRLSRQLQEQCNVVHLSSGELLRDEVEQETTLGNQVRHLMARGELVSSAIMVALMKKRMKNHPGKRVLLDGFPRSLENAHDLVTICGRPELALYLVCDDTFLMERIMNRKDNRADDNFQTAIERIRTYHKYHHQTIEWLREEHVPVVNLDACGSPESVWQQLVAIGKLMRPAVKLTGLVDNNTGSTAAAASNDGEDNSNDANAGWKSIFR